VRRMHESAGELPQGACFAADGREGHDPKIIALGGRGSGWTDPPHLLAVADERFVANDGDVQWALLVDKRDHAVDELRPLKSRTRRNVMSPPRWSSPQA